MRAYRIAAAAVAALLLFYLAFVHYTDTYHVALVWDPFAGRVVLDDVAGFNLTPPWVRVARIDVRPQRVCVTSSSRSYNCKLVEFVPKEYGKFVETEGFRYYWFSNRISFNMGYPEEYRGVRDILRGYAYGSNQYPFIKIIREYESSH